ncbi:endonuclease I family protein [Halobacillus sp. Marseille-P3879]|uniref:endonuclease I family protein n=1 Tax=Halobacillus sp. Marseille-P3879 TaxID=2045014 RepID=UPI001F295BC2|nr:endonuclease [Halobacillus sp. Marseille-P3879]
MNLYSGPTNERQFEQLLDKVRKERSALEKGDRPYFDEKKAEQAVEEYYESVDLTDLNSIGRVVKDTHTNPVSYDPSEYLYPWVDLRSDGQLRNIYSGERRDAEQVIKEDYEIVKQRKAAVEEEGLNEITILRDLKFNCEHAVPQSWFNGEEPMRGDLHHLFTCEPVCNSIRSNYPYYDFKDYPNHDAGINRIEEHCGKAEDERFEPEHGKGPAARAMLYFLLRYPAHIDSSYKQEIDQDLLLTWHEKEPPELYELHRNQAIYEIQGNRNPWIDLPKDMLKVVKSAGTPFSK